MKLISPKETESRLKKEEAFLTEKVTRLKGFLKGGTDRLNSLKDSYEPDKERELRKFEAFCEGITLKKAAMLEELKGIDRLLDDRKELYYALAERKDELEERMAILEERSRKLDDRERFIVESERRLKEGWDNAIKK